MNTRRLLGFVLFAALMGSAATAFGEELSKSESSKPIRLVVYTPMTAKEPALEKLAKIIAEDILVHVGRRNDFEVLGEADLDLMLAHAADKADLSGPECQRVEECLARISAAADAQKVLVSRLGKLGDTFIATFSLSNGKTLAVERSETCSAEDEAALRAAVIVAIEAVLGHGTVREATFVLSGDIRKIAVMPMSGLADRPDVVDSLTQLFGIELRRAGLPVITADEVTAMVDHRIIREQCKGEGDMTECLVDIGLALDVSAIASGAVARLQDTLVVVLKLIDIQRGEVIHRVSESFRGEESHLPRVIFFLVNALLGRTIEGEGDLLVVTDIEGQLTLDKDQPRRLPLLEPIRGLKSGKHNVAIADDDQDYHLYLGEIFISPGLELRFEPTLIEREPEWYESWWFIGSVGVAVAAGTVTTFLLLQQEGGSVMTDFR